MTRKGRSIPFSSVLRLIVELALDGVDTSQTDTRLVPLLATLHTKTSSPYDHYRVGEASGTFLSHLHPLQFIFYAERE